MTDWKETALWKHLETASGLEADAARALLIQEMPGIQTILTQAHTAPTDFTLHDADHSFRVAKWMAEIIPGDVLERLSPYEITLLLLATYLHDIGMTPEQGRVERFWYYLVYGSPDPKGPRQTLTEEEARDLQGWLDDEGREITVPLAPDGAASEATKRHADLLIAHYCRHKHNDWSAEWIRAPLRREALPGYETWVDDLVQLCRSHHEGYEELKQSRFDPRPAGPSGLPIHHRYLACVLRVADVLEIDPERTPEVIFRHREIHPGSLLYWRKDHENWILRDGNGLVLTAYPESAVLENAIRRTADGIQQELSICARLDREEPFSRWKLLRTKELPHRWDFPEVLTVHVQPRNDAYVYIDGAFRPNTEKLLELLSGTQLYGNPLVAVRELLQNAFDAVKEEMAYQRLERPGDPEFAKHLAATHRVELRLETRDGRQWLVCKDTGVGMTRRIIEDYLLVSGNSHRRKIVELERRCRNAGFRLARTGQFGIGVLSYFMLADRVEIRTRRSAARADAEATGWSFVTEGVGSFGELKKEPSATPGTEVRLRLKEGMKTRQPFDPELKKYLEVVNHIPCILQLQGFGEEVISWKAGWVRSRNELVEGVFQNIPYGWHYAATRALQWRVEEGELPNGLGTYRVSVPWFELPGGRCQAFMLVRTEAQQRFITPLRGNEYGILFNFSPSEYVCGMRVNYRHDVTRVLLRNGLVEINWESSEAGRLHVDREALELSRVALDARQWATGRVDKIFDEVLSEKPSQYTFLSDVLVAESKSEPCWASRSTLETADLAWGRVSFPIAPAVDMELLETPVSFRGEDLAVLPHLLFRGGSLSPSFFQSSPGSIVARCPKLSTFGVVRVWQKILNPDEGDILGMRSRFPPEWGKVCVAIFNRPNEAVWNISHPITSRVAMDSADWFESLKNYYIDREVFSFVQSNLTISGRAPLVLASILISHNAEHAWATLFKGDPLLAERLWQAALGSTAAGKEERSVGVLRRGLGSRWELIVVTADSVTVASPCEPLFEEFLPPPGPDWVITEAASDDGPT